MIKTRIFALVQKGSHGQKSNLIFDYSILTLIVLSIVSIILTRNGHDKLFSVDESMKVGEAIGLLNKEGIDQVPVVRGEQFVGSLTTNKVLQKIIASPELRSEPVEQVMDDPLPFVAIDETLDVMSSMLNKESRALLVRSDDHEVHIITQHDLLMAMSK